MATRWQLTVVATCTFLAASLAHADIYRWDTGEVIPGTEGITPGPGVDLRGWDTVGHNLRYADFSGGVDLTGALFGAFISTVDFPSPPTVTNGSWLDHADFSDADLTGSSFARYGTLVGGAVIEAPAATLTNAKFTGALVTGANFRDTTSHGFTQAQLASTASYQAKNLSGIILGENDLTGWDFSGQNLTDAWFFFATLTDANLTGAVVTGADFHDTTRLGFTKEQLYSTASYQAGNLQGIGLGHNSLSGWDFCGQNLTGADLHRSTLTGADLTGAVVTGADFYGTTLFGFTKEQLYSTASYQAGNLQGIGLRTNDLSGWDFSGQNLTDADLTYSFLTNANLSGAVVTGAQFAGRTPSLGFTKEQLYSTASYQQKNLQRIRFRSIDLTGWDFSGQNLTHATLRGTLTDANLSGANLTNADLRQATLTNATLTEANLTNAYLRQATLTNAILTEANLKNANLEFVADLQTAALGPSIVYNQWTRFPDDFDPVARGLTFVHSAEGDFMADDVLDVADIDMLTFELLPGRSRYWLEDMFDLNNDTQVNHEDHRIWVKDLENTWYGDANLDGEFNSSDMVQVFAAGKYEREAIVDKWGVILNPVSWSDGDWNGDGLFDSADMVTAFVDGGYEQGPRPDAAPVPEPTSLFLLILPTGSLIAWRRRLSRRRCL